MADGDFVIDHDTALALAAAQAVGLRELYQALCEARAALGRAPPHTRSTPPDALRDVMVVDGPPFADHHG